MSQSARSRAYDQLTAPDIPAQLSRQSVLCLPIGSIEQHGPHLPLNTDTIIAEGFAYRLAEHHRGQHDLWVLPPLTYGLSPEHMWSPGTISLRTRVLSGLLDALVGEYARATPARRLLIVNGHSGNRGILEALARELQHTHGMTVCVVAPNSLPTEALDSELPEIHAGVRETSLMLALVPETVRLDRLPHGYIQDPGQRDAIEQLVVRRGTTWPWSSGNPAISSLGIIGGDPRKADAAIGESIIASALEASDNILAQLTHRTTMSQ